MRGQGCEQLTLFQGDSPVSRFPLPGSAEARMITVTSGRRCSELLRNSSPLGLLAKMLLESSTWHSTLCWLTWKAKATKQGRLYFQLVASTPRISVIDAPLWPTPTARDCKGANSAVKLIQAAKLYPTPTTGAGLCGGTGNFQQLKALEADGVISAEERRSFAAGNGGRLNPEWVEAMMGFPIGWTASKPGGQTEVGSSESPA